MHMAPPNRNLTTPDIEFALFAASIVSVAFNIWWLMHFCDCAVLFLMEAWCELHQHIIVS